VTILQARIRLRDAWVLLRAKFSATGRMKILQARIGLRDAWVLLRAKFSVGPLVAILATLVTLAFSGSTTWWAPASWAIAIVAIVAFFICRALFGYNGLWRREVLAQPNGGVSLALHYKGKVADRHTARGREASCTVEDPQERAITRTMSSAAAASGTSSTRPTSLEHQGSRAGRTRLPGANAMERCQHRDQHRASGISSMSAPSKAHD
jgi:hypothetical protein